MKIKPVVYLALILAFVFSKTSVAQQMVDGNKLCTMKEEIAGIESYMTGDYKKAFKRLSVCASVGYKYAQYLLGQMYFKGVYVEKSEEIGIAWIGVSREVEIEEWVATYDELFNSLPLDKRLIIDKKVKNYKRLYGMHAQKMECVNRTKLGSQRIELFCAKKPGAITPLYQLENAPGSGIGGSGAPFSNF